MSRTGIHRQEMISLIDQWQQSGMSQKDFLVKHQLSPARFYYWLRRYRQVKESTGPDIAFQSNAFVEIKTNPVASDVIEVVSPSGYKVVFHGSVSMEVLRGLIG